MRNNKMRDWLRLQVQVRLLTKVRGVAVGRVILSRTSKEKNVPELCWTTSKPLDIRKPTASPPFPLYSLAAGPAQVSSKRTKQRSVQRASTAMACCRCVSKNKKKRSVCIHCICMWVRGCVGLFVCMFVCGCLSVCLSVCVSVCACL